MIRTSKFEDKVAITGVGASEIGRRLMRTPLSLTVEACSRAVEDAGLAFEDIDGLSSYPGGGNFGGLGEAGVTALEAALGLRPTWYNGGIETFGPGGSLIAAMLAVAGGLARHAVDLAKPPVLVEAVGTQILERIDWDQSTLTHEPQALGPAAHLWTRTSLRPSDVDVAELYDGFTINCLTWIEALGFCGIGEAKDFLDGGKDIARDGQLPLNTHGGQLSHGRTHGMGLIQEAIVQLRGEAGERQVAGASVAAVSSGGLTPGGALLLRAAR
jgi:acetyl-CoA acetyltransferase